MGKRKATTLLALVLLVLATSACLQNKPGGEPVADTPSLPTFGDLVTFDGMQLIFGNSIIYSEIDNPYSDMDGQKVFLVPLATKNIREATHGLSMFSFAQYGPSSEKLESVGAYFPSDITFAGDMRPGAMHDTYMAFQYCGDGVYSVEFGAALSEIQKVALPIKWDDKSASPLAANPKKIQGSYKPNPSQGAAVPGEAFEFDGFEITFLSDIQWSVIDNPYSGWHNADIALVPVIVTNNNDTTRSIGLLDFWQYGSKGTRLDSIGSYFDNEIAFMDELEPNESYKGIMAFAYDGDGAYFVEFKKPSSTSKAEIMLILDK
ncbi:MAG: DUF4352 domain-containing protein [Eubacteriaceae bacterium]|nr:DUF4352 domain-containing protein [Eubacteriaceae bacterium]